MGSESGGHKTEIIVAVITVAGGLMGTAIANWDKLFPNERARAEGKVSAAAPERTTDEARLPPQQPSPAPAVTGEWRDGFGTVVHMVQTGNTFSFTATGVGCQGYFRSTGTGTLQGTSVRTTYRSNYSDGTCKGSVTADGSSMTLTCSDRLCGEFTNTALRQ